MDRCFAFNSLSRDHIIMMSGLVDGVIVEPFNSLSRDHRQLGKVVKVDKESYTLSTPSLGITFRLYINGRIVDESGLSTPSLGITEPDSGIFRLSAAFCRGTPSHK